jgi:hypothetical protein
LITNHAIEDFEPEYAYRLRTLEAAELSLAGNWAKSVVSIADENLREHQASLARAVFSAERSASEYKEAIHWALGPGASDRRG